MNGTLKDILVVVAALVVYELVVRKMLTKATGA